MPAPAVRLRAEFSDILGEEWQLNIHDADYAGSIVSFNVGGDAYQLRYEGNNEDRHQPIIGSSLEFSIIENSANITTFIDYLPNSQDGELTVTLRYDPDGVNTLYWAGVILPEQVVRKDEAYPQEVRIIASDDLGNLAGIDFDNDGTPYVYSDGRSLRDIIVKHCLGKIRTKDHWGASDIYASLDSAFTPSNLYGTGDFFSNIIVNSETWLNVQPNGEQKLFSTMEVLRTVCITFNARLFLANGRFWMIPIVSHHDSQTLTYLNYYSSGTYTSSSTVDVGLTLQTDIIKEAGWEYTHQLPLKRVERSFAFNANNPIGVEEEHLEASFGTDIFNFADYTFPAGTQFKISGYYTHSMTAQGGNNTLARLHANFFIKSGTKYHKHEHTYSGAAYYYNFPNSHSPTVLGDSTWTTSSADRTQVPLLNLNAATGDTFPVITDTYKGFGYTTDPLPTEETGIQIQVDFVVRNPNGTTNSTWKSATNLNFYWIELRVLNADGDSINYVATNALNARSTLDQGQVYIGDYMGTGPPYGKLYVKTGASTFSTSETWTSTTFTTGQDIHRLGVQEVLRGQKLPLLIERGTLYANNAGTLLHMYNVVLSDSRRMGIYQYTYNGRMRNYDIELFHITGNASDISVVGKPPRDVLPPIAPSSTNSTLNDGIVDEVGQTKFELDDLDATVSGLSVRIERLYDTFQPLDDDTHTVTKIVHEANATTGMSVLLEEGTATIQSNSGNTYWSLGESSPGQMRVFVQDDATPTPNSVGAMFITAASNVGKVGINTSTPAAALDVVGNIAVSGTVDGRDVASDGAKLDGIAAGAEVNQNAFTTIAVSGQSDVVADSETDTLTLAAANTNLTITTNATSDTVTLGVASDLVLSSVSTTGNVFALGSITGNNLTIGNVSSSGDITANSATLGNLYFTGGGTSTIGPNNSLPTDPADLEIRTNGNCDVVLDYDDNEISQAFRVKDGDGNVMFAVDEDGISVANGTSSTGAVLRLGEATANGTNYVGIQAPTSLAANTTYTLPTADGTSGQVLSTNGSGTLSFVTRKATQVTGKTVATGAWSLISGFYEASISDAAISATSIVDVIPDNGSAATAATAGVLPRTDSSSGAVKIYATTTPAATLTVTLNIFDL